MKPVIYKSAKADVLFDANAACLSATFHGFIPSEEFRKVHKAMMDYTLTYNIGKHYIDYSQGGIISPDDIQWMTEVFFPAIFKVVKYSAVVLPSDTVFNPAHMVVMNQMTRKIIPNSYKDHRLFHTKAEAEAFLLSQN